MEQIFSEQEYVSKQANDGRIQLKQLSILKNILNYITNLEKKALTQIQSKIEELLFNLIMNNRITSDILSRYLCYIYIHLFNKGRNSHFTDLINSVIEIFEQEQKFKNISDNIKCTFLWIIGYIYKRCEYKSPSIVTLTEILIDVCNTKETSDLFVNEAIKLISKFLNANINNNLGNKIPEIYKLISKIERNILNKKYILKCIYGSLLHYENKDLIEINFFHKKYNFLMELLENYFQIKDESINNLAIKTFLFLHEKIIFKEETLQEYLDLTPPSSTTENSSNKIDKKRKKIDIKSNELLNFLHVIKYFSQIDLMKYYVNKTQENGMRIISHLNIIIHYIQQYKEIINLNESALDDIFELLINSYSLNIYLTSLTFIDGLDIYYNTNDLTMVKSAEKEEEIYNKKKLEEHVINKTILLYRTFIKSIYITSHRKYFLFELFSKLKEVQTYIDKLTEDNKVTMNDLSVLIENGIINKVYTIPQINVLLLSLLEISETNSELFELNYNSFQDISNNISFFLTSGIRPFRIFITKFVCNLSYYLPNYRTSILSLILNLVSLSYNRISKLKNGMQYFNNTAQQEYKNSLTIHKNLSLFKDICNCLAIALCTIKHKANGVSLKMVEDALNIAIKIILGNENNIDISNSIFSEDFCQSLEEDSNDYFNKRLFACKECGWIIIQGICSLGQKLVLKENKSLFFLFKHAFNKKSCKLNPDSLKSREYKDNLISEFFNKKEALHCLNKFIISLKNNDEYLLLFKEDLIYLLNQIIEFFLPEQNLDFISFYQYHLFDAYNDARTIIYEIFYNLPISFFMDKFNDLVRSLSYNIASNNYSYRYLYKYYYDLLNNMDTFNCLEHINIDDDLHPNSYFIDSCFPSQIFKNINNKNRENYIHQNYFNYKTFSFIFNSSCLLVKIFSHDKLSLKNKNAVIKFFLNSITDILVKGFDFKSINEKSKTNQYQICNYNKLLNITMFVYLFLKHSIKYDINYLKDLELFTNIKMIFDLCYKIEDIGLLNIISCEGISFMINLYEKKDETLEHYLRLNEIRFNSTKTISNSNDYLYSFYLIGNIFRNVDYSYIKPFIDKYMNFIISYFNPNDIVINNPFVVQSLIIICDCLIKEEEYDKVEKIVQIYIMNIIYINGSNKHFFKNRAIHETINEIKLLIILIKIYENLADKEKKLMKYILKKIFEDKLYKYEYYKKYILLLINEILNQNLVNEFSEYLFDINLIEFLFETKKYFTNNLISLAIINYLLKNNYNQIENISKKINKDNSYIKNKMSVYVHRLNELYNENKDYFYINKIYKSTINIKSNLNNDLSNILDFNVFDKMFNNYKLITIYKKIIINYISKAYKNIDDSINLLKIILQKKINLYKNIPELNQKDKSSEGGDESLKENQDNFNINNSKILFNLNNFKYLFHIKLQKFLIKEILKSLLKYTTEIISLKSNNNNKTLIEKSKTDILSKLMSISMILVQSEESYQIKYLGVKLLYKLIKLFSNIKDSRSDDDSLLIQQYEVQISSCIKNIFNSKSKNPVNFKIILKGFNLIYLFLTISISNDLEYIKKYNEYTHFLVFLENKFNEIHKIQIQNNTINYCTEKEENIVNYRFFILVCQLFISSFTKKDFNIKYIKKSIEAKDIEIHSTLMAEEIKNHFKELFKKNSINFCNNLKNYLYHIYKCLLMKDINQEKFNRNLHYSDKHRLKYASFFLTVISIILHNDLLKNYEDIFDKSFLLFLFELIFYLLKSINKYKNSKEAVFYIIDIFCSIINNKNLKYNYEIFSLFLEQYNDLIRINDFKENKNFISLFQKFTDNLLISDSDISKENNINLIKKEIELIKILRKNFTSNFDDIFIMIFYNSILKILKIYDKEDAALDEQFDYFNKSIFVYYTENNKNNINKLLLEKIYTILININDKTKNILKKFIKELIDSLIKLTENFQKYYALFYLIIQYISKSSNIELIKEIKSFYITESLKTENKLYEISNTSFFVFISKMNNPKIILFINEYLSSIFNNKNIFLFSQELQKLILIYIQNEQNNEQRKNMIKDVIKYLNTNNNLMPIKDASNFILGIVRINKDDANLINDEEIKKLFNEDIKKQINESLNINETQQKENENEENKDDNKEDEGEDDDGFDEVEG